MCWPTGCAPLAAAASPRGRNWLFLSWKPCSDFARWCPGCVTCPESAPDQLQSPLAVVLLRLALLLPEPACQLPSYPGQHAARQLCRSDLL